MTVGELLERVSSSELTEWIAIYTLEHEDQMRRDLERDANNNHSQVMSRPRRR
jgi:hypothetical protein